MKQIISIILILCAALVSGEVTFSDPDLSSSDQLLFRATSEAPVTGTFNTVLHSDIKNKALEQITFFPEVVMLAGEENYYQVINRFGVFRSDAELKVLNAVERFPSFVRGGEISTGKISVPSSSPDGNYLLILSKTEEGNGDLILYDSESGEETVVSSGLEYRISSSPAIWAPISGFFIYEKQGNLYYYSLEQLREGRVINEEFRTIGAGGIANVHWGDDGNLYYVSGSLVYRVRSEELFTRTLYAKLLNIGEVAGKIPFDFDPNFDTFWISPDGSKILLGKSGRNIFLFFLQSDDFLSTGEIQSLPYLFLPRNTQVRKVLWSNRDSIAILAGSIEHGEQKTGIFTLDLTSGSGEYVFKRSGEEGVIDLALSPDYKTVAVLREDSIVLRSYADWTDLLTVDIKSPMHALWRTNDSLIVAGKYYSALVNAGTGATEVICLSQADEYGFDAADGGVRLSVGGEVFAYSGETGISRISE
ncbi:MAG: polysaccharide deacetylase family protein, partial [Spirochaetales bacterium]|nr:polysaccharide deacetylase family protein [Spirochaetales bacterium]